MPSRPLLGLATQTLEAIPGKLPSCWVMAQPYVQALVSAGGVPWLIPLLEGDEATLRAIFDRLDGILLTGGVDIDPDCYGEQRHDLCDRSDPPRDWTEMTLIRWAVADRKPVLGICRGIQAINVACGGSLYQDVAAQYPGAIKHDYFSTNGCPRDYLAHDVRVESESRLAQLLGTDHCRVNSMHHQGIKQLAPGLTATAFAPDGLIEGVEMSDRFVVGVQWHPEELTDSHEPMRRLFAGFVAAAGASTS